MQEDENRLVCGMHRPEKLRVRAQVSRHKLRLHMTAISHLSISQKTSKGALSFSPDPDLITLTKRFSQSILLKCATRCVCVVGPRVSSSFPLSRGWEAVHPLRYMSSGDVAARGQKSFTLLARGREQGPSQPCEIGSFPFAF
jgi:hypothetical protein